MAMSRSSRETYEDMDERPRYDDDVIVLNKWWVISAGVGLVFFILGMAAGYFAFSLTMEQQLAEVAALAAAGQGAGGSGAAAIQPTQPPARIDNVSVDDDPALGPDDAPITMVEFSDFQCPFCERFHQETFNALMDEYGDLIHFVYRDFPLTSIHPQAMQGAMAGECADAQGKFWEMHDLIFANQASMAVGQSLYVDFTGQLDMDTAQFEQCMNSNEYQDEIAADMRDGQAYGVTGTPTFFINGVRVVGAQP